MRRIATILAVATFASLSACYHATVETGRPASPEVLLIPWAASWIGGLVPPSTVSAASKCPDGVAEGRNPAELPEWAGGGPHV